MAKARFLAACRSAQALTANFAGHGTPEGAEAQQESLVAALATAPGQMAAQQAGQTPQTPSSTRKGAASAKDNAIAARDNVAQFEKQATSAALLAQALATTEAAPALNIIMAAEGAEARFSLVSLEAAKPAGTKTSGEGRADGLALQAPGFALPDGQIFTSAYTLFDGVAIQRDAQGCGQATVVFEKLPLMKGRFSVGAYLFDERALHVYDVVLQAATVVVTQAGVHQGFVQLPHRWK
jgi:hypothetical protein